MDDCGVPAITDDDEMDFWRASASATGTWDSATCSVLTARCTEYGVPNCRYDDSRTCSFTLPIAAQCQSALLPKWQVGI